MYIEAKDKNRKTDRKKFFRKNVTLAHETCITQQRAESSEKSRKEVRIMEERNIYTRKMLKTFTAFIITLAVIATLIPGMGLKADAASLKTAVFPVNNGKKIAYIYGYSKSYGGNHSGIDIHAGKDNRVYCAVSGKVISVNNKCNHYSSYNEKSKDYMKCNHINTYGNSVYILGDDGWYYIYGHVAKNSITVKKGQKVKAGVAIAKIGSSGASTGPHLHFEVRKKLSSASSRVNVNKNVVFNYKNGPYYNGSFDGALTDIIKKFALTDTIVNNKIYTISPAACTNTAIAVNGTSNKSNAFLKAYNKNDKAQQWKAVKSGKYFFFVNVKSGKCLDVSVNSVNSASNGKNVWTYTKQTSKSTIPTQLFKAACKNNGFRSYYHVTLYNTKFSLDAAGNSPKKGSNVQIYKLTGSDNETQQWIFKEV